MVHLSKRVLAIALVVAAAAAAATASGVVGEHPAAAASGGAEENPKHTSTPTWCIAKPKTPQHQLENLIDKLCGLPDVDCSAIEKNGPCYYPATYIHHASYAMNYHFHVTGGHPEDCTYGGYGYVVNEFPLKNGGCYYHPQDDKNRHNHPEVHSGHQSHSAGQNHHSSANHAAHHPPEVQAAVTRTVYKAPGIEAQVTTPVPVHHRGNAQEPEEL